MLQPQLDKKITTQLNTTLPQVAHDFYGNFENWRELSIVNAIDIFAPLALGKEIKIPSKEEIDQLVNEVQSNVNAITNIDYSKLDLSVLTVAVSSANPYQLIDWVS